MPPVQAVCTSFKAQLLTATHNFSVSGSGGSTFKLALYTSSSTIDANTTAYTTINEVPSSGTNYTAGGNSLVNVGVTTANTNATAGTGFTDFNDLVFSNVTLTARGALIYNSTATNAAVVVLDFGSDKTASAGDLTIVFPAATNTAAIIRVG